jgi:hypothetical protein
MAWRPKDNLIEGELDNTVLGKVTGWLKFLGMAEVVRLDLAGDFASDVRGRRLRLRNPKPTHRNGDPGYMDKFSATQTGEVGDITAGLPPYPHVKYPYVEWYSRENGRVVMEFEADEVEVVKADEAGR